MDSLALEAQAQRPGFQHAPGDLWDVDGARLLQQAWAGLLQGPPELK